MRSHIIKIFEYFSMGQQIKVSLTIQAVRSSGDFCRKIFISANIYENEKYACRCFIVLK